ncbi:MAG: nitrite reductase, copper-containing [Elusimicrobia bacterium]|nr:nitrite reductase, copper-containing [Elusimicrobiota bacterium]MDE2236465.1 nitrite reductase, copper-containing [Elusimicrobiota bacterium]MDE2424844.1 nitrite reductase, copper-containing [Elusimicrobiota bacterium]
MRRMLIIAAALLAASYGAAETVVKAQLTYAPEVPAPIARTSPAVVRVDLETKEVDGTLMEGLEAPTQYHFWTFNGHVPGPFIRVRVGDTLELHLTNPAVNSMAHNIDLHAVTGPGGGAAITLAQPGETKVARFKMLQPGFFVYHCAAPPVTDHIANGMYGVILVEPEKGLPKVDREFYVMQSEFYTKQEYGYEGMTTYDADKAAAETPTYIVFNGRVGSLTEGNALKAKTGDSVRIFFANIGPNKVSSFHTIGTIFDKVFLNGGLGENPPLRHIQTVLVPAGGAAVVELKVQVPGDYSLVDHSIFRLSKGAVGILHVDGKPAPGIYEAMK